MLKVMILDDERLVRDLLKACIDWSELGMTIVAESGSAVEGLELVDKHMPDIILTDICMPVMDGIELCRALKAAPGLRDLPIIAASAFPQLPGALNGLVDAFLPKPLDFQRLHHALAAHLPDQ